MDDAEIQHGSLAGMFLLKTCLTLPKCCRYQCVIGTVCNRNVCNGSQHASPHSPLHKHSQVWRPGFPLGKSQEVFLHVCHWCFFFAKSYSLVLDHIVVICHMTPADRQKCVDVVDCHHVWSEGWSWWCMSPQSLISLFCHTVWVSL